MALPPDVQAAIERMDKAKAALLAEAESGERSDRARRVQLQGELKLATDDLLEKIGRLR